MEEGSRKLKETFDPMSAITKWSIDKVRRATQEKGSRSFKSPNSAEVNVKSLSDDNREDEKKNISDNGYAECFLLIPSKMIIKKFPLVAK